MAMIARVAVGWNTEIVGEPGPAVRGNMKQTLEIFAEISAVTAAVLWFISARVRLRRRDLTKRGLGSGTDDPRALLRMIYEQSQWSAWAAIAAGLAALFALADGFAR